MSDKLEIDIRQSVTVQGQAPGAVPTDVTPVIPSGSVQSPQPPAPESVRPALPMSEQPAISAVEQSQPVSPELIQPPLVQVLQPEPVVSEDVAFQGPVQSVSFPSDDVPFQVPVEPAQPPLDGAPVVPDEGAPPVQDGAGGGGAGGPPGGAGGAAGAGGAGQGLVAAAASFANLVFWVELGIRAFDHLWQTVKALDQQFLQMSKDAAKYNGQVAAAQAMAEVRDLFAQLRRAEELGPRLASYTTERSMLGVELQDLITDISKPLLDGMEEGVRSLRALLAVLQVYVDFSTGFYESISGFLPEGVTVADVSEWISNPTVKAVKEAILLFKSMNQAKEEKFLMDQIKDFLDANKLRERLQGGAPPPIPAGGKGF